ncbi:hypothetical protein BBOV_III001780 [Babesia bovis T2Bo]|uniref:RanBP2-type domain-containing protein n=1 Tax=Babesia bovis TaxID=5865 RepID=A7AMG1_BABBO|nr:hypothetical protein BBOV_III001780 [Babesia bovis T2Bo]EDO07745.1 hypothetical protein BBOV_III001780 [Babesia bovis T2Bo]|eukprot:XP_001611313.1 hypothetical protein [Babesia bovis T2Bo]
MPRSDYRSSSRKYRSISHDRGYQSRERYRKDDRAGYRRRRSPSSDSSYVSRRVSRSRVSHERRRSDSSPRYSHDRSRSREVISRRIHRRRHSSRDSHSLSPRPHRSRRRDGIDKEPDNARYSKPSGSQHEQAVETASDSCPNTLQSDTAAMLRSTLGNSTDITLDSLNSEFREMNYSRAYGIDISGFVGVQSEVLKVDIPTEQKPLSNYERRQQRKEEILKHPDRFWKCKRCGYMNYLSNYECTGCQQLRNANR